MRDSPLARLIASLAMLATLAALAWWEMPPARRQLATLTARQAARRQLHRLARASGYHAMGRELAGTPERDAGYRLTYRLSSLRDRV